MDGHGSRSGATRRVAAIVAALLGVPAGNAVAAPSRAPDLAMGNVSAAPATVTPGQRLEVRFALTNRGRRHAGRSVVAFRLSRDRRASKDDLALKGTRGARRIGPGRRFSGRANVSVPTSAAAGAYHVIACADARRKVREPNERNNCRAAGKVAVATPAGGAAAPGGGPPIAPPLPAATPSPDPVGPAAPDFPPPPEAEPMLAVAISATAPQRVVRFDVTAPGTLLSDAPVTGLGAAERIVAVDRRPADGRLLAHTDAGRLLALDAATGAVEELASAALGAGPLGHDVSPVDGQLDVVDPAGRRVRVDPATGVVTELAPLAYAPPAGPAPMVSALAYSGNLPGAFGSRLYGLDTARDVLVELTDEASGLLDTIGPTTVDASSGASLDAFGTSAYAALTPASDPRTSLYRINLATGAATMIGGIGAAGRYDALALLPGALSMPAVHTSSDLWEPGVAALEELLLTLDRDKLCPADQSARALSLAAALESAEQFLRERSGQAALDAFAGSPEAADPLLASKAAAAALSAGEPGAALAALLRAHELAPSDPTVLLNAGGVASAVGLPSEGLAMIGAAAALPEPERAPMGLSWTGRIQIARAHAYASLSDWNAAEAGAESALAHDSVLGQEAASILAAVSLCRDGDRPQAAARRVRARVRNAPAEDVDGSRGRAHQLRNIPIPALPKNGAGDAPFYAQFADDLITEMLDNNQRSNALRAITNQRRNDAPPAVRRAREGLSARIVAVSQQRDVDSARREAVDAIGDAADERRRMFNETGGTEYERFFDESAAACEDAADYSACFQEEISSRCVPATKLAHSGWGNAMARAMSLSRSMHELESRRKSAIAAHFADPDEHAVAMLSIEFDEISVASGLVQEIEYWTDALRDHEDHCVDPPEPQQSGESPPATPAPGEPCPPELKRLNVKIGLSDGLTAGGSPYEVGVKVNCEEVEGEGSIEVLPWIKAFASVNNAPKSGTTTIVVGGRASISVPGAEASFTSAAYVKVDSQGNFQDAGWRLGPGGGASSGIAEYQAEDMMDLSFVQGVQHLFAN